MGSMNDLKEQALKIVRDAKGKRRAISTETGLGYDWLNSFAQGRIKEPGVSKIEKLIQWKSKAA